MTLLPVEQAEILRRAIEGGALEAATTGDLEAEARLLATAEGLIGERLSTAAAEVLVQWLWNSVERRWVAAGTTEGVTGWLDWAIACDLRRIAGRRDAVEILASRRPAGDDRRR